MPSMLKKTIGLASKTAGSFSGTGSEEELTQEKANDDPSLL